MVVAVIVVVVVMLVVVMVMLVVVVVVATSMIAMPPMHSDTEGGVSLGLEVSWQRHPVLTVLQPTRLVATPPTGRLAEVVVKIPEVGGVTCICECVCGVSVCSCACVCVHVWRTILRIEIQLGSTRIVYAEAVFQTKTSYASDRK